MVVLGHCTTLKCMARGTPQPSLTWYFNNKKIRLTNRIRKDENGTLHIQGARESDAGLYTCEAKNDVDTIVTDATLQVTGNFFFLLRFFQSIFVTVTQF